MAHYLILTHLRESMEEMPLLDAMGVGTRKRGAAAAAECGAEEQPAAKRARIDARDPTRLRHVGCVHHVVCPKCSPQNGVRPYAASSLAC